jgi:type I restriction enzyme S subunit
MSEWKEYRLGELTTVIPGYAFKGKEFGDNGCRVVKIGDIAPPIVDVANCLKIPTSKINGLDKFKIQNGDFVLAMTGATLGKVGRYLSEETGYINQRVAKFENINGISDKQFLYYLITSHYVSNEIINRGLGSAQPNISGKDIESINVIAPDLPTQTAIAEILSSLDDKIELNNKINQELENLAQTLFKRWFIDFEFPNENGEPYKSSGGEMVDSELGEIPKGWVLDSLDKIADFLNGLALQKFPAASDFDFLPVIKIRELRQKDTTNSDKASSAIPAKYIIHNGDVLFSWSGTLMVDFWTNGKGALNQHLFKVTSNQFPKWFYYLWTKHHLSEFIKIAESKATTMGHIQRQHLSDAKVVIPNEINNFSVIIEPFITKIINNRIESFELIQLRDSLLPKLISGELEVKQTIN